MGKAATLKWIKSEARNLPQKIAIRPVKNRFTGSQMIGEGTTHLKNGRPIKAKNIYTTTTQESFVIDHYEVMKELYKKSGKQAVLDYIKSNNNQNVTDNESTQASQLSE